LCHYIVVLYWRPTQLTTIIIVLTIIIVFNIVFNKYILAENFDCEICKKKNEIKKVERAIYHVIYLSQVQTYKTYTGWFNCKAL